MDKNIALQALDEEPEAAHSVVLVVDGQEMDDPMEIMEFIMENKEMFMPGMKTGAKPEAMVEEVKTNPFEDID